jgi:alpha-1,6-mannosyltransferase
MAGAAVGGVVVLSAGRVGLATSTTPFTSWFGLLARTLVNPQRSPIPGLVLAVAVCALVVIWLLTLRSMRTSTVAQADLWRLAGWWSVPFLIGPPLLSSDVFSYVAQGLLVAHGHDPYSTGPSALGWGPPLAAVDPSWRNEPSPYGPLATLIEHLSVVLGGGTALGALIVLRLLAAVSVVVIGMLAVRIAGPRGAATALGLTVLNPVMLMYVLGGVHFEGIMCALLLAAIYAANRGQVYLGLMLGCGAGAIKAPGLVVVLAIVFMSWNTNRRTGVRPLLVRSAGVIGACWVVFTLVVPNGWGWLRSLGTPTLTSTPAAVSTLLSSLLSVVIPAPAGADAAYACRVTALFAAVLITGYLLVTAHHRPLAKTAGLALVALSLLSPVFYPWYALWGLVCLAPVAVGRRRDWLVALSALSVTVNLPGLTTPRAAVFDIVVAVAVAIPLLRFSRGDLAALRRQLPQLRQSGFRRSRRVDVTTADPGRNPARNQSALLPDDTVVRALPRAPATTATGPTAESILDQCSDDWSARIPTPVASAMNSSTDRNTSSV